ncbi:hypothetical protein [Sphingobacterium tabacisoli]|uniref:Uncharacterized protein n=1 Tax=Sphingobacterium tabacisoli TaxID=2044855 RepID=A0ABW5L8R1_9SPHI|nr:hypothetical protein [Sphingobacterium tabacisoli]
MIKIQLGNPEVLVLRIDKSMGVEDVLENIFPLDTDYSFLIWNNIFIPLSYKYDIPVMVFDFIKILSFLRDDNVLDLEVHWASNTFASIWILRKTDHHVHIKAEWKDVNGGLEGLLNNSNYTNVNVCEFDEQIKKVLMFLQAAIVKSKANLDLIYDYKKLHHWVG